MLEAIKKKFFNAGNTEKEASMKQENQQPVLAAPEMEAQLSAALASLASQTADMEALSELVEEMSSKFDAVNKALAASEEAKATLVAQAVAARLEARTKLVVEAVGTDKADALLSATDSLADEQFNAIVSAMVTSFEKEAKTLPFIEAGVSAEATPHVVDPVTKLATAIAEKFNPA